MVVVVGVFTFLGDVVVDVVDVVDVVVVVVVVEVVDDDFGEGSV